MSLITDFSNAIWNYSSRTLEAGTPPAPTNLAEEYSDAIWNYNTRTLDTQSVMTELFGGLRIATDNNAFSVVADNSGNFIDTDKEIPFGDYLFTVHEHSGFICLAVINSNSIAKSSSEYFDRGILFNTADFLNGKIIPFYGLLSNTSDMPICSSILNGIPLATNMNGQLIVSIVNQTPDEYFEFMYMGNPVLGARIGNKRYLISKID